MDADLNDGRKPTAADAQCYYSVALPQPGEGVSNALHAAFDSSDDPMPHEFAQLLQQLN